MLKIINTLTPFFEDCYRRINVREFARIQKISPPTASKELEELFKKNILKKELDKQYIYYYANKDSDIFVDLSRIYWKSILNPVVDFLEKELLNPIVILFGSLSKAEVTTNSDIDLAIITKSNKDLNLEKFERKLKRNIQTFVFKELDKKNNLHNNILNGCKLRGEF
ncbi:MAG: nucleotidyltransferase domain-containing protein [Candidatus Woesearchaeota archaeon]